MCLLTGNSLHIIISCYLFNKGREIFSLNTSINGPMKKAVIIVAIPTKVGITEILPPPMRKTMIPTITQIKSVVILQNLNFAMCHLPERIIAIAS